MKPLEKDELYQNLHGFLKTKGVEFKDGSYSSRIQKACGLLSDAINASQQGLARAKAQVDKKLDQLRQVIHEKTAPPSSGSTPKSASEPSAQSTPPKPKQSRSASRKRTKPRKSA